MFTHQSLHFTSSTGSRTEDLRVSFGPIVSEVDPFGDHSTPSLLWEIKLFKIRVNVQLS